MGLEAKCAAVIARKTLSGTLHVDSKELTFKAKDLTWSLLLSPTPKASVAEAWLEVPGAKFELGPAAAKWLDKILHPPSRLTKLGIKPETSIWIGGEAPRDFLHECQDNGISIVNKRGNAGIGLFFLGAANELQTAPGPDAPLWLIYPKGGKTIKEPEVMAWAKQHGVGASKTLSFDGKLTGLRFGAKNS